MSNMVIRTNVMSLNSHRNLGLTGSAQARASQRLSSGFRINSAADDAAGLGISEKMRAQIRGLDQASRNGQDGISLIQTAEGAMSTINEMVTRIRELVVQAANDTNAHDGTDQASWALSDRTRIQDEINQLMDEIDATRNRVEFNTRTLLNGSLDGDTATFDPALTWSAITAAGITAPTVDIGAGLTSNQQQALLSLITANAAYFAAFEADGETATATIDAAWVARNITAGQLSALTGVESVAGVSVFATIAVSVHGESVFTTGSQYTAGSVGETIFTTGSVYTASRFTTDSVYTESTATGWSSGPGADTVLTHNDTYNIAYGSAYTAGSVFTTGSQYYANSQFTGGPATTGATVFTTGSAYTADSAYASVAATAVGSVDSLYGTLPIDSQAGFTDSAAIVAGIVSFLDDIRANTATTMQPEAGNALWFHVGANSNQGVHLNIADVGTSHLSLVGTRGGAVENAISNALARQGHQLAVTVEDAEEFTFAALRSFLPGQEFSGVTSTAHGAVGGVLRTSGEEINLFLTAIDMALSHVTGERSNLGAMQNRLEYTIENLDIASENLQAANSRIRDADMAREMMRLTQMNVLQQAATAMLAQANQAPQMVLQLLG